MPQTIIARAHIDGPLQFGFEMGTGVRTFMPSALPHAALLTTVLIGGIGPGVLVGLGFGLGRALMPLVRSTRRDTAAWDADLLTRLVWIGRLCAIGFVLSIAALVYSGST